MSRANEKSKSQPRVRWALPLLLLAPIGCAEGTAPMGNGGHGVFLHHDRAVEGQYIVKIDDTAIAMHGGGEDAGREIARALAEEAGGRLIEGLDGKRGVFAVELSEAGAEDLSWDRRVAYVEADAVVTAAALDEAPQSWGIDRIDQRKLPLDSTADIGNGGEGVTVYVIDSGIRTDHVVFGGRASIGFSAVADPYVTTDCNGHGTHVAGTAVGNSVGLARNADVVSVRVLGCDGSGSTSQHLMGIEWVIENAELPAVINASVGAPSSPVIVEAYEKAIDAGITVVVAAGNDSKDACDFSPANTPRALTVAASDQNDAFADFSNHGGCVDMIAPGVEIHSAWFTAETEGKFLNGTSMASPHVAGAAAMLLGEHPEASPKEIAETLIESATRDTVQGTVGDTPNLLLYSAPGSWADDGGGPDDGGDEPDGGGDQPDDGEPDDGEDPPTNDECLAACGNAQSTCTGPDLGLDCAQLCSAGVGDPACYASITSCVQMASCL